MAHPQLASGELDVDRSDSTDEMTSDPVITPPEQQSSGEHVRMHPATLRFPPSLEREFADVYFAQTLGQIRLSFVLGFLLYALFGILDIWIAPTHRRELWIIRFAIVCPLIAASLAFTYTSAYRRVKEPVTSLLVLIMALGIVAMLVVIPPPGSYLYYGGLILAIVYLFTLVRLTVPYALGLASTVIVSYIVTAIWIIGTPATLIVNNLFFLVSSAIIGFLANYTMERYARTNFLQRREIERRTRQLEQQNSLLSAKNRQLAESRAAIARSAERSELIFSALSEALPGTLLDGKYRVEDKIGSGGFGTVYRGEHVLLHHPVAIKVFRPAVGQIALAALERFRIEGITACRIAHPNAVTVLDFDVSGGSLAYLVMELLDGRSLADELRETRKLPPVRCASIMADVCSALAEAHAAGIVHRDIKPSNVFLHRSKGEEIVKVIDFGIAKLTDETTDPALRSATATATGMLVGTPAYMAPERLGDEAYDGRADVFAVGVMMFECLCGRLPFQTASGGGYWSLAMMNALGKTPAPSEVEPSIPAELESIVIRAMAKAPADRPVAAELMAELRRFVAGQVGAAV